MTIQPICICRLSVSYLKGFRHDFGHIRILKEVFKAFAVSANSKEHHCCGRVLSAGPANAGSSENVHPIEGWDALVAVLALRIPIQPQTDLPQRPRLTADRV
jgi:hypothetical protein